MDHSGNREYTGEIIYNQDVAYAIAEELNRKETEEVKDNGK